MLSNETLNSVDMVGSAMFTIPADRVDINVPFAVTVKIIHLRLKRGGRKVI